MAVDPQLVKSLFLVASDLNTSAECAAYLDRECAGQSDLRARVESLLSAHFSLVMGLSPAVETTPNADAASNQLTAAAASHNSDDAAGLVLAGKYKLLERIGEGGMGSVWLAQQSEPMKRKVAVKLIRLGMDSRQVLHRFEAERQALAMMDHPNIAKVLDGGLAPDGRPFFVMELVKGTPITDFCDARKLSLAQRLELFVPVCQAIQHAHQKGIIHRDIKPSNVMIAMYDDHPVPKVIDFGIAKATGQSLSEATLNTGFGGVIGTPQYMSPEQATLNNLDIDTRSDVYSLGVLLYELLTGSPPFTKAELDNKGLMEVLRVVREDEPPRPSTKLSSADTLPTLSANRSIEPRRLTQMLQSELDWIVMKALEKNRARRYETANSLAADVQRYLTGEPVTAHPPSATYQLQKFVRRHRGPLVAASVVVLALLVGAATVITVKVRANRELAVKNVELADEQSKLEVRNRKLADEQAKVLARETQAIDAVRRFGYVVSKNEALKNNPELESLRKELLTEPLAFFRNLRTRLQADRDTSPESLERLANASDELAILTRDIGDLQNALIAIRESLAIDQKMFDATPNDAGRRSNLSEDHNTVADMLMDTGKPAEAEAEFRQAIALRQRLVDEHPDAAQYRSNLAASRHGLGDVLSATGRPAEAEAEYRRAIALSQKVADENPADTRARSFLGNHHHNLGLVLEATGQSAKADSEYLAGVAIYQKLVDENPANTEFRTNLADGHLSLANLASITGKREEGTAEIRSALAEYQQLADDHPSVTLFRSRAALGHFNLAGHLDPEKPAEVVTEYRIVLGMYQKLADDHPSVTEFREYLARSHQNLALPMERTGNLAGAEIEMRAAVAIMQKLADENPTITEYRSVLAGTRHDLGGILAATGKLAEAEAEYRKAIVLSQKATDEDPSSVRNRQFLANHHFNLGNLLMETGRLAEAEAEYRQAQATYRKLVDAEPTVTAFATNLALIHRNMGFLLLEMCRAAEAVAEFRQSLELAPDSDESKAGLAQAQRLTAMLDKLPALLKGDYKPTTNDDRIAFAQVCATKKQYRAAAGLFTAAFAAEPRLAADPISEYRYDAACCASLAASPGEDAAVLEDQERARLRKQALDWLRADLAMRTKQQESGPPAARAAVPQQMKQWQQDPHLAGIRDADALASLPADEQKSFTQLWSEVAELLKKSEEK